MGHTSELVNLALLSAEPRLRGAGSGGADRANAVGDGGVEVTGEHGGVHRASFAVHTST